MAVSLHACAACTLPCQSLLCRPLAGRHCDICFASLQKHGAFTTCSASISEWRYVAAGIRCDIYSTYLRRQGFNNLFTLEGGVQNYLKQAGGDMWVGSLFVFDKRLAISPPGVATCLLHQRCETQHLICMAVCGAQASFGSSTVAVLWTALLSETRDLCPTLLPCSAALAGCRPALNPSPTRIVTKPCIQPCAALHAPSALLAGQQAASGELPAAVSCACGQPAALPHLNCANIDCNRLFLACSACQVGSCH